MKKMLLFDCAPLSVFSYICLMLNLSCGYSEKETSPVEAAQSPSGIQVYPKNAFYWALNDQPVFLIGGSKEDNLFQIEDVKAHLDLLHSVGGNYVRCTMSARDKNNQKPFLQDPEGLYDLDRPNPDYWKKLEDLLQHSRKLNIVVQIEIWATYDFYWGESGWAQNPFNPKLTGSYTAEDSGLADTINYPAQNKNNPFFLTVPALQDNKIVMKYQKVFVDKLLETTLPFDNVLYSIDNETTAHFEWGRYWSGYLHKKADSYGKKIYVTEMWDNWDPTEGAVPKALVQNPELGDWYRENLNPDLHDTARFEFSLKDTTSYQFLDVSNHNAQKGEVHYLTGLWTRNEVARSGRIRPINNVKIYGGSLDRIWSGGPRDGKERFWRNVFAGHAAVRFHRESAGIALTEEAQTQIRSLRMLINRQSIFDLKPWNGLLSERADNEAYCLANQNQDTLIVYFPEQGSVFVDALPGTYSAYGLDISSSNWKEVKILKLPGEVVNPMTDSYAVILKKQS